MAGGTHAAYSSASTDDVKAPMTGRLIAVVIAVVVCVLVVAISLSGSGPLIPKSAPSVTSAGIELDVSTPSSSAEASSEAADGQMTRSKAGAVNAAAGYATLLARLFPLDVSEAKSVVAEASSDDARARLVAAVEANLLPLQERANGIEGTTTYRQAVLATHLGAYSADSPAESGTAQQAVTAAGARARVTVWTLLIVAQTPQMPDHNTNAIGSFGTVNLSLVWERGAWRIDDSTTLDGPTPLIDGTPSSGAQLNSALCGFVDWRP